MTKTVTLNLTLEELKTLDKYVELNDETRPLFDKIRNAYPKPTTLYDALQCPLYINGYHFNEDQKDWICKVVEEWLPDEVKYDGEEYDMGWNDAIQKVKDNLFK